MIGVISSYKMVLRPRPLGRLLLATLMACALFLQAFVTETHIHEAGISPANIISIALTGTSGHHQAPGRDDPAKCPICQQIWRAGQFLAPSWASPLLLVLSVSYVEIATYERPRFITISHAWRGRGPPQN
jgi:hypothetical protein